MSDSRYVEIYDRREKKQKNKPTSCFHTDPEVVLIPRVFWDNTASHNSAQKWRVSD